MLKSRLQVVNLPSVRAGKRGNIVMLLLVSCGHVPPARMLWRLQKRVFRVLPIGRVSGG
nr:MAG TPA: hypothetical protein [Caudoviricetes sp.]